LDQERKLSFPSELLIKGAAIPIEIHAGMSTIIVGANGTGKTRLAMECERQLDTSAHRISAQRMLALDPSIEKASEEMARNRLRYGYHKPNDFGGVQQTRLVNRWGQGQPTFILNDAGHLLQLLFAEQANIAVKAYNASAEGIRVPAQDTFLRKLKAIFHRVLPTRTLEVTADDVRAVPSSDKTNGKSYSITEMSDGEKAVFYIIGQTLVAEQGSVFIMDEPEIHVHRSILGRLWDELEAARQDCAFLLITHDLEFAASRAGKKYVVRSYAPDSGWSIENVPEAKGFSEDIVTLILGSRKPILFVEGEQGSLDVAFYRACYPGWTVLPRGGCESVIHSVVTMRRNAALTRVQCAGLVDADSRGAEQVKYLADNGIYVLPVSEIENLVLLPTVSRAILAMNDLDADEIELKLANLKKAIFADAQVEKNINEVILGFCRRRIDQSLKTIDLSNAESVDELHAFYKERTSSLDVRELADEVRTRIADAVGNDDLIALLAIYDRKKPLLALASSHLRNWNIEVFSSWLVRAMQSSHDDRLREAVISALPKLKES
jgi:ABC-type cobalamin/Fe3+-siderophores transport system ATPase subunit